MKKLFFALLLLLQFIFLPTSVLASSGETVPQTTFFKGEVTKILNKQTIYKTDSAMQQQTFQIKILDGEEEGNTVNIIQTFIPNSDNNQIKRGDKVVVSSSIDASGQHFYSIFEQYRLDSFWYLLVGFIILIIFIGGKKGIGASFGLAISLIIISQWMIPQIVLHGQDPLRIIITAAAVMLFVTTYIAHGFSLKTTVAVIGTAGALILTGWLSSILADSLRLYGLGNEDIYQLQIGSTHSFDTQGLLLGAILIGTLGALNDITTTQSITMFTLVRENPKQKFRDLFSKGMNIGKEHIASLVNTLVLAYAGSSLGIFIFITLNPANLPWWVILNNETTMEEIISTLVGSTALILAVPFTTLLATLIALRGTTYKELLKPSSPKKNHQKP